VKQFLLQTEPAADGQVVLTGRDFHYLAQVLRLSPGECLEALTPAGRTVVLQLASVGRGSLTAFVRPGFPDQVQGGPGKQGLPKGAASGLRLILFQALAKPAKMDLIVRQAAEAGLEEVVVFRSARSYPGGGGSSGGSAEASACAETSAYAKRLERWERIVREARQQSGSPMPTTVRQVKNLAAALQYWVQKPSPAKTSFIFTPPAQALANNAMSLYLKHAPLLAGLGVGPEGGFEEEEVKSFISAGFIPVQLACRNVLRCETAAIYTVAAVQSLWEALNA
jgi:16S rRNA (uracil1498-N3)-methyltransferase